MHWYIAVLKKYAVFNGRAQRKEYWYFILCNFLLSFAVGNVETVTGNVNAETGMGMISMFYAVLMLMPSISVGVRRLHDTGRSGWWMLLAFIPILGSLVLIYFFTIDSDPGENPYGQNPKHNQFGKEEERQEREQQEKSSREKERQKKEREEKSRREKERQERERQEQEQSRKKEKPKNSNEKKRSYEEILGLSSGWTKSDLKTAYRSKCHQTHPDKWESFPEDIIIRLEKEYKEVQKAYKYLSKK